ncbi:MAG: winged helix-turn-helix transcriptional regulator [Candidatus Micrarchaeota archaeon]
MRRYFSIRIRYISSQEGDVIERLCESVGVVSGRDRDKTVILVFRTMLKNCKEDGVGGSELSELSGVNRITCLHHLKRLEEAGLVENEHGRYHLKCANLKRTMRELRKEALSTFDIIDEMAGEIDKLTWED